MTGKSKLDLLESDVLLLLSRFAGHGDASSGTEMLAALRLVLDRLSVSLGERRLLDDLTASDTHIIVIHFDERRVHRINARCSICTARERTATDEESETEGDHLRRRIEAAERLVDVLRRHTRRDCEGTWQDAVRDALAAFDATAMDHEGTL